MTKNTRKKGRSLQYEPLESREMLSASAGLRNGVLTVSGTKYAEAVYINQTAGVISIAGVQGSWSADQVNSIYINLNKGGDVVSLDSLAHGGTESLAENVVISSNKKESVTVHLANGHDV
ncbi:MAG TPA: hypothetical protein VHE81_15055, partial [Lacipirellulaceae bacterium]|nr:hypothetical protein [Lacipirellulaceae bacterium]